MKTRLSHAEKQLAGALVAVAALLIGILVWPRIRNPRLLPTPIPVISAEFVNQNQIFVTMASSRTGNSRPSSVLALYEVASGHQLWSIMSDDPAALNYFTQYRVSPDGQWLLTSHWIGANKVTLTNTKTRAVLRTFAADFGDWLDASHFTLVRKHDQQIWAIKNGGPQLERTTKKFFTVSPDQKLGIESWLEEEKTKQAPVAPVAPAAPVAPPQPFRLEHSYIVSTRDGKRLHRLPGDGWRGFSWQKNGTQLWGVAVLTTSRLRADILRYDLSTRRTTATRLEPSDDRLRRNLSLMTFEFSPDGRWAASLHFNSHVLWDAATGLEKKIFEADDPRGYSPRNKPSFSPDSQFLLRPTRKGVELYRLVAKQ